MNWFTISESWSFSSTNVPAAATLPPDDDVARVREDRQLLDVVRHDDAGDAERVVHLPHQPHDHAHRDRIEAGERLVVDQHLRIGRHRARERHAPRHAAGQLRGHQPRRAAQADGLQLRQHDVADQRFGQIGVLAQRERDVLEHVDVREQRAVLEQHAHAPAQRVQLARA